MADLLATSDELNLLEKLLGPGIGKKHGKRHRSMLSIQSGELNLLEKLRGTRNSEEAWKASQVYVVYTKWRVKPLRKATWDQEQ